jgi:hypothetical protein
MEGRQITLLADEGYVEQDIQRGTQRWISSFEKRFRQYPSDWIFMLDRNWARVLKAVVATLPKKAPASNTSYQESFNSGQRTSQGG